MLGDWIVLACVEDEYIRADQFVGRGERLVQLCCINSNGFFFWGGGGDSKQTIFI